MNISPNASKETLDYLKRMNDAEILAEEILIDKQQIIDFDRRRNTNREAYRQLMDAKKKPVQFQDKKMWLCMKDMFILLPSSKAAEFIEKDQKNIDEEINSVRDQLKVKMSKLSDIEGTADKSKPYFLNAINK
eukprot:TRINITY_DN3883_c0_g1_i2.p1 TRINITY_DN3883_c0_g1~~TRINITY_DN3883_c0_g1_i2.p1  ORF type:complete len:133 (-),score=32.70 TRINITY_DN3883_c0_g1_i2:111-509(-)